MRAILGVCFCLVSLCSTAAPFGGTNTQARLILSAAAARPGDTVLAGVHLRMAPGWHTYWRNGGDSGDPTKIKWKLPGGITAGVIKWPPPEKFTTAGLLAYGYHDEVVLLVPLKLADNAPRGPLRIEAEVSWLECEKVCVPGSAEVSATIQVGEERKISADAALIEKFQKKLPASGDKLSACARWDGTGTNDERPLLIEFNATGPAESWDFFPYKGARFEVGPVTERLVSDPGLVSLRTTVKRLEGLFPTNIAGLLLQSGEGREPAMVCEVNLALPPVEPSSGASAASVQPQQGKSLWAMLGLAFLGGLILNVMPCVLPVIALKILGFVNQGKEEPKRVRRLGIIYALGVMVSFLVLAGFVIGVQQTGRLASWGMQFQNPQFLVVMTALVTLVALNLFGLFEIHLGGTVMGAATDLTVKEGDSGAFFNGVLATTLATPCTAPFLGYALGFAFTQPPVIIVVMFLTVALGLAAPYVILSWQPAWLKFLPKPGKWMERFKIAMGFPMLATAVWLFSLTIAHFGKGVLWLGLFLVVLALAAWVWGEFVQRGHRKKLLAMGVSLLLTAGGYAYALERQLRWRSPTPVAMAGGLPRHNPGGIEWQPWSPEAVEQARAGGRPMLVDFTADWCIICQGNKKSSIEIPSVRARLKEINAVALLGDYTLKDEAISEELQKFGRAGVPLVLVYSARPQEPPQVLPELLTPGVVLRALDRAAHRPN